MDVECVIIEYDDRIKEYDLDVLAAVSFEAIIDDRILPPKISRVDVVPMSSTLSFADLEDNRFSLLVIPKVVSEMLPKLNILGEVYATERVIRDYRYWEVDSGMVEMVIFNYLTRLHYLRGLQDIEKHRKQLKRYNRK